MEKTLGVCFSMLLKIENQSKILKKISLIYRDLRVVDFTPVVQKEYYVKLKPFCQG